MSIQREFPSYDDMKGFADLLDKLPGFVDSSWHNDTCPSMEHEQSQTRIWVEYADPDNRENAGPRFSIEQGDLLVECVFSTDDAALVVEWVKKSRQLTPEKCGASQLACNIVNNTFLSLDGFAAMRKQMECTEYTAQHFGAELARIVDRETGELIEVMQEMVADLEDELVALGWSSIDQYHRACGKNKPHMRAVEILKRFDVYKRSSNMRHITVYMSDGDTISTNINGTDEEIMRHYLGNRFEAGCDTKHHVALCIHFHDNDKRYGLRIKCIEHNGLSGCISHVRKDTVKIDDNNSYEEIMLVTRSDAEYALNDVWVYDMDGNWIEGIGYKHATTETMYVAHNSEHGYLVMDSDFGWRYTQDKTKATENIKSEWDDIARQLTHRFKLVAI